MILPILDREKINLDVPLCTLDVNQVALKDPTQWGASMQGLAPLEWNYFEGESVELCVTPETAFEISKGQSVEELPYTGYRRLLKTEFFKSRPSGTTLSLSEQEANTLWGGIRSILWPTVTNEYLNPNQRADVSQLYFHTISSGSTCANATFLSIDNDILSKREIISQELGVTVLTPSEAWEEFQPAYGLYEPTSDEIAFVHAQQVSYLEQLSTRSSSGL